MLCLVKISRIPTSVDYVIFERALIKITFVTTKNFRYQAFAVLWVHARWLSRSSDRSSLRGRENVGVRDVRRSENYQRLPLAAGKVFEEIIKPTNQHGQIEVANKWKLPRGLLLPFIEVWIKLDSVPGAADSERIWEASCAFWWRSDQQRFSRIRPWSDAVGPEGCTRSDRLLFGLMRVQSKFIIIFSIFLGPRNFQHPKRIFRSRDLNS